MIAIYIAERYTIFFLNVVWILPLDLYDEESHFIMSFFVFSFISFAIAMSEMINFITLDPFLNRRLQIFEIVIYLLNYSLFSQSKILFFFLETFFYNVALSECPHPFLFLLVLISSVLANYYQWTMSTMDLWLMLLLPIGFSLAGMIYSFYRSTCVSSPAPLLIV